MPPRKNTRFGRGRYNTDYAPDENGAFRYTGVYHRLALEKEARRRLMLRLVLPAAAAVPAFVLAGLGNTLAGRTLYALLPYMCCVLPLFYLWLGLVHALRHGGEPLTEKGMDESFRRILHSAVGLCVCAGLALAGGIVMCLVHRVLSAELPFLIGCVLLLLCGLAAALAVHKAPIEKGK